MSAFPLARVAGTEAPGGLEAHHDQPKSLIVLLVPYQDGTKQGRRCSHSTWSLVDFWPAFPCMGVASRICFAYLSWSILAHSGTNTAVISLFGEVAQHSELYEFQSCALCRKVSHRELFAKSQFLPLALGIALFQSLPKIHDHKWGSEQRPI